MGKKAGYLETDDLEMVHYDNDVSLDDVESADFNSELQPNELDNEIEKIDLKNTSTQKTAKKIVKKYRNLKRKGQLVNYSKLNNKLRRRHCFYKTGSCISKRQAKKINCRRRESWVSKTSSCTSER